MLQGLFSTVDKLPLAGKYTIEPLMKGYVRAPSRWGECVFAGNALVLGTFITVHLVQARMGVEAFLNHTQDLEATGNVEDILYMPIDAAFTLLNAAVTLRQVALLDRVTQIRERRRQREELTTTEKRAPRATGASPPYWNVSYGLQELPQQ